MRPGGKRSCSRCQNCHRALGDLQAVALDQLVEAVPAMVREQAARQLHGAQHLGPDVEPGAAQGGAQVAMVEAGVVGDEEAAVEAVEDLVGDLGEARRVGHHRVVDAGQPADGVGDARLGPDQGGPLAHPILVDLDDGDLGDRFALGGAAGGLDVDEGEAAGGEAGQGRQGRSGNGTRALRPRPGGEVSASARLGREAPALRLDLPANAIGKDYRPRWPDRRCKKSRPSRAGE